MALPNGRQDPPGPAARTGGSSKFVIILILVAAAALGYLVYQRQTSETPSQSDQPAGPSAASGPQSGGGAGPGSAPAGSPAAQGSSEARGQLSPEGAPGAPPPPPPSSTSPVVNLDQGSTAQGQEQRERMEPYGVRHSLDAVVRSDESIKVGDTTISMAELEKNLVVNQRGEILEKPLDKKAAQKRITAWGVYLVRQDQNLWNIHYRLLREYLASQGVELAPDADEPLPTGKSSGVGKILKFAEHMVGVYNLKTKSMSSNLDHLEPGRKVVVFNLSEIFSQLAKIDPRDLSGVMYDGRVLLFPGAGRDKPAGESPGTAKPE